jgi:hypothetical protein
VNGARDATRLLIDFSRPPRHLRRCLPGITGHNLTNPGMLEMTETPFISLRSSSAKHRHAVLDRVAGWPAHLSPECLGSMHAQVSALSKCDSFSTRPGATERSLLSKQHAGQSDSQIPTRWYLPSIAVLRHEEQRQAIRGRRPRCHRVTCQFDSSQAPRQRPTMMGGN